MCNLSAASRCANGVREQNLDDKTSTAVPCLSPCCLCKFNLFAIHLLCKSFAYTFRHFGGHLSLSLRLKVDPWIFQRRERHRETPRYTWRKDTATREAKGDLWHRKLRTPTDSRGKRTNLEPNRVHSGQAWIPHTRGSSCMEIQKRTQTGKEGSPQKRKPLKSSSRVEKA